MGILKNQYRKFGYSYCWIQLFFILSIGTGFVISHWINLHIWHEEVNEISETMKQDTTAAAALNSTTYEFRQMQRDASAVSNSIDNLPGGVNKTIENDIPVLKPLPACNQLPGLTQAQIDICMVFTDHMRAVINGAQLGLSECRWQFRHHHWNCSSPPPLPTNTNDRGSTNRSFPLHASAVSIPGTSRKRSVKNHSISENLDSAWNEILKQGSKEVAFAHAVWSAAVTQAVARSCRDGSLTSCSCGKTPRPPDLKREWKWGGCGDNLQYGYKFATDFVDSREKEKRLEKKFHAKSLVNLHNNEAGRRAVLKKTKIVCKCHGVSGSCILVTCWHQVPSFREIGDHLKDRYAKATLVKMNRRGRLQVKKSGVKIPSVHDLVYIENSPNYCVQNETLGIFGPSGRICNRTSTGPDGCKSLCCNKGFSTNVIRNTYRCNCKFVWCCQVVCQECKKTQKLSSCK